MMIKACIFDLDGVIVDTAKYHFKAWKQLANDLGFDFSERDNEKLKGVGRMDSLNLILGWGNVEMEEAEKEKLAANKNEHYKSFISKMSSNEIMEGVVPFLEELKSQNIKIALGSASKNAQFILEQIELKHFFEAIIDGTKTENGKPHPEVFLKGAEALEVSPSECVVFEDAEKGVEAALAAGMYVVGIGNPQILNKAHMVMEGFKHVSFEEVSEVIKAQSYS